MTQTITHRTRKGVRFMIKRTYGKACSIYEPIWKRFADVPAYKNCVVCYADTRRYCFANVDPKAMNRWLDYFADRRNMAINEQETSR